MERDLLVEGVRIVQALKCGWITLDEARQATAALYGWPVYQG